MYTVLTYAAASLVKATRIPLHGANQTASDIQRPLDLARKASDILARAALSSTDLSALQGKLLAKLIENRLNDLSPPPRSPMITDNVPSAEIGHVNHLSPSYESTSGAANLTAPVASGSSQFIVGAGTDFDMTSWFDAPYHGFMDYTGLDNVNSGFLALEDDLSFTHESIW